MAVFPDPCGAWWSPLPVEKHESLYLQHAESASRLYSTRTDQPLSAWRGILQSHIQHEQGGHSGEYRSDSKFVPIATLFGLVSTCTSHRAAVDPPASPQLSLAVGHLIRAIDFHCFDRGANKNTRFLIPCQRHPAGGL